MGTPQQLLDEFDELLKSLPDEALPPLPFFNDNRCSTRVEKKTRVVNYITQNISKIILSTNASATIRTCSIGCGNGVFDGKWLSSVSKEFPNLKIEHVGVDLDSDACAMAEKNLRALNIDSKVVCQGIQEGLDEEPFDVIVSVSSFYYFQYPEKVLEICKKLISPKGFMMVSLTEEKPLLELFTRFWRRQFNCEVCYPPKFKSALESLNIPFKVYFDEDTTDISEGLQDGFSQDHQRHCINCFNQVDTFKYPDAVVKKVIDYFAAVAISDGSRKILKCNRQIFILF